MKQLEWRTYKYLKNALVADAIAGTMYIIDFGGTEHRNESNEIVELSSTNTMDVYCCDLGYNRLIDFADCTDESDAKVKCQQHHDDTIWKWLIASGPKLSNQRVIML